MNRHTNDVSLVNSLSRRTLLQSSGLGFGMLALRYLLGQEQRAAHKLQPIPVRALRTSRQTQV